MHAAPVRQEREHDPQDVTAEPSSVPAAPMPLVVGAADDHAEVDADRRADHALARLAPSGGPAHEPGVRRSASAPSGAIGPAGGALDGDTEARLSARLGRGGALDASVRRRMEGAFGTSFSGVNVHTDGEADRLSRQMSATAFTVGKDMFFSQGAYRPGDASGDRLIAHELAHVEQDSASARRMVHRAVGFEFETNVVLKQKTLGGGVKRYKKGAVIKDYGGLKMTADEHSVWGSTIEWVVDPPLDEHWVARERLVDLLDELKSDVAKIEAAVVVPGSDFDRADPDDKPKPANDFPSANIGGVDKEARFSPVPQVRGNPQVTGGIAIDKIATMMGELGNGAKPNMLTDSEKAGAADLTGFAPGTTGQSAARVRAAALPSGADASDALKGLAALLTGYLKMGDKSTGPRLNYAKLISNSTLVRTDFATVFKQIPQTERDELSANNGVVFSDWILALTGLAGTGATKVFDKDVRKTNDQRSKDYAKFTSSLTMTREEWLSGITRGRDELSAKHNKKQADKLEGLGRLGDKMDDVGQQGGIPAKGIVMEFRNLTRDRTVDEFGAIALQTFDYIVQLNNRG